MFVDAPVSAELSGSPFFLPLVPSQPSIFGACVLGYMSDKVIRC